MVEEKKERKAEVKMADETRILFAAPKSGSGKTLITCGFLEVLKRRGISPVSYKCGPDYIDPMFHKYVLGVAGGNLDSFFLGEEEAAEAIKPAACTVIEGVMGYYDGLGGISTKASTYDIARITKTPAVLILDCKGASVSLAAMAKGFMDFKEDSRIAGVILNRLSPMLYERLTPVFSEAGIRVFGYVPESELFRLESRHLGLLMPQEVEKMREIITALAVSMEKTVDIDGLLKLAKEAEHLSRKRHEDFSDMTSAPGLKTPLRIGVAKDEAFCFYYQENLRLMEKMGAELLFFSPIHDKSLPEGVNGLLLGGGYPENFARELSENQPILKAVKQAAEADMPILAECGGFLYLHRSLEGSDGQEYAMAGVVGEKAYRTNKLGRFGYVTLTSPRKENIKGHEFHYWESTDPGSTWMAEKPMSQKKWKCMHEKGNLLCGFPHLYYPSNPDFLREWLGKCRNWKRK